MDVADQCCIQQGFCFDPEIIASLAFTLGVGNEGGDQLQNVLFTVDISEGVLVHGLLEVDGIEDFKLVLESQEHLTALGNDAALGISNDKTDRVFLGSALHEIGCQPEAGRTGAASADNQHILVSCGFGIRRPIIHGQAFRLGEDEIVCEHRVNIGLYVSLGAPTGGAVFHVLPEFLCVLALDVDRQSNGQGNQNTNTQVNGMETGHRRFKRQHQPLHDVQCFPGKVGSGSQPYSLTDLGSKQGDEHIGNVGKE